MSQFKFLQPEFNPVFKFASKAEAFALSDPRGACFYARFALEASVKWLYARDKTLRFPYENTLSALIHEPTFRKLLGHPLVTKAKVIKDLGNRAVHDIKPISEQAAITALRELFHFSYWLVRTYAKGTKPDPGVQFSAKALKQTTQIEATTLKRIQAMAQQAEEKAKAEDAERKARLKSDEDREKLEAEIKRLQKEITETKKANQAIPDDHDYNEAETRDAFIDLLLHEAGWPLEDERDREYPVTGMPNPTGEGFVDYVLWGDDGKPLALVEAKRTKRDARVGQQQAKLYADCLENQFKVRPVIFYTNGYEHWLWDDKSYPPRPVQGFLKKEELMLLHQRRLNRKSLSKIDLDEDIAGRYYQTRAIRRIGETFEKDHLRKALLVMATGSGKTRTVISLVDQLMRANWVKRVLFLADRKALVTQAVNAFKKHLPHVAPVNLVTDKETEGRVYVSTYPTMMNLIDQVQNGVRRFGSGHFDLIVIDEAHRSVYRKYKAIFDYFDSLLVGLTATPRDEVDRDTYSLFELEQGVPTDNYDLDQAVEDGYLVPAKAVSVPLKFVQRGITYEELSEEEKDQWDMLDWDEDGEIPERVEASEINKRLFNKDSVDKVLAFLMRQGIKVADGDRLGKTIIFAKNHKHALFIQERFDTNYKKYDGHFAKVIDFKTTYAQSLIDDFSNPKKFPHIAISVDMLDTGIDIPEVVNLVFFKIVRSKTKFWQMIGRGTRLCPDLLAPGDDKIYFQVFDFCQNFEYFNQNPDKTDGSLGESLSEKLFKSRIELISYIDGNKLINEIPENSDPLLVFRNKVEKYLYNEVAAMNLENFVVRPKRLYVEKFKNKAIWDQLTKDDQLELIEHIAGLPSELKDEDITARQFDYLVLNTQLSLLKSNPSFKTYQKKIREIASQLEDLSNIPMVAHQLELIQEVQTDEYWLDITLPILELLRLRLRSLVQLIEQKSRKIVYTDFVDEIGDAESIDLPQASNGTNKERFERKIQHFLKHHQDHITIQKLKRNEQLTPLDLSELERIFIEESVCSSEELEKLKKAGGLGLFIRSLIGLDQEAAKEAFAGFLLGKQLNANQIEFINMIINHLTSKGVIQPKQLYESPFTDFNDLGISGLFNHSNTKDLLNILTDINQRAMA